MKSSEQNLYIGCMTGTSVDGLDLALVQVDPAITVHAAASVPLPDALRTTLLALGQPDQSLGLDELGLADAQLGEFVGHSVLEFLTSLQVDPNSIAAIGSHGQTVRHRPGQFTLQIGDANRIAEITGIPTVADFRRRDVAAGGQGAPLVPLFHQALFGQQPGTVVLNIGGISNITVLGDHLLGFDTGPGNGLMDSWYVHHHPEHPLSYDEDGTWAASGQVDQGLLSNFLTDPFFNAAPPKSTGREHFNLNWLQQFLENQSASDVQATLCQLTAVSITGALATHAATTQRLVVCGGGRLNGHLLQQIRQHTSAEVVNCDALDIDGDALEAAAFAWLAYRTLHQLPGNSPSVTGADGPRILGTIYPGQSD